MAKILLVEDDCDLAKLISVTVATKAHALQHVGSGSDAKAHLRAYKFDLIILDWMLPDISGLEVLQYFRGIAGVAPVLMLTSRDSLDDKEAGLDAGADDYLTKPFQPRELLARIRALLRRPQTVSGSTLQAGDVVLDPITCQVTKAGIEIHLRPKVYSLLEFLMRHQDQVFSAEAILERVWADDSMASPETVRTHIKLLRKAIDGDGDNSLISNVRNRGYMLRSNNQGGTAE